MCVRRLHRGQFVWLQETETIWQLTDEVGKKQCRAGREKLQDCCADARTGLLPTHQLRQEKRGLQRLPVGAPEFDSLRPISTVLLNGTSYKSYTYMLFSVDFEKFV
jgi:hypothetical protein